MSWLPTHNPFDVTEWPRQISRDVGNVGSRLADWWYGVTPPHTAPAPASPTQIAGTTANTITGWTPEQLDYQDRLNWENWRLDPFNDIGDGSPNSWVSSILPIAALGLGFYLFFKR